jgi:hypothetical protein
LADLSHAKVIFAQQRSHGNSRLEGQAFTDTEIGWIYEFTIASSEHVPTIHQAAAGS